MKTLWKLGRSTAVRCFASGALVVAPTAWSQMTIPNTFTANTSAVAADVNANFTAVANGVNNLATTVGNKQNRVTGICPSGQSIRAVNADGSVVCQAAGFFGGNGSAGDLTVSASASWSTSPPANPLFHNITINSGQTLSVPAGTTIRCSGSFTNNGTLAVLGGAENEGTSFFQDATGASSGAISLAHPGDTRRAAIAGQMDNDAIAAGKNLLAGPGGVGVPQAYARTAFGQFRLGGGAGAGYATNITGGGLVRIYCDGPIVNAGTINASGASSATTAHGGGGGGIVILASRTFVNNTSTATINAAGGNGGNSNATFGGAGGGGGGGIVVVAAPTTAVLGTVNVAGGLAGASGTTLTNQTRSAGGGGGGSGGNGGAGGSVSTTGFANAAQAGALGYLVTMALDPAALAQ